MTTKLGKVFLNILDNAQHELHNRRQQHEAWQGVWQPTRSTATQQGLQLQRGVFQLPHGVQLLSPCLSEKYTIMFQPMLPTLNQRDEFYTPCMHIAQAEQAPRQDLILIGLEIVMPCPVNIFVTIICLSEDCGVKSHV